jgi:hypothetical protein
MTHFLILEKSGLVNSSKAKKEVLDWWFLNHPKSHLSLQSQGVSKLGQNLYTQLK